MASDNRSSTYLTVAAVTFAAGLAAYAVYFDYRRRNDVEFRKKLKKEKKRVQKAVAEDKQSTEAATATLAGVTPATLKSAIQTIRAEQPPRTPEEQEQFFMAQIAVGEKLAAEGPESYLPSAMAFFRALRVYPAPVELIVIYEKTIIEPVFKLIMELTQLDVSDTSSPADAQSGLDEGSSSPPRGPPSEASSQEWDRVTDPDAPA
ncbi:hypothetical protein D9619_000546 [Psilocybe cf. subviscida]|uniref:Mitochondrial import receptor subunit TOM20 n=1 Tax=Psilocybe cf. subviscida TaxID=2480587 RepID=A0A8H5F3Z2_9AGAR|nr:hypothetical protein D9619_000546 [Psilocybe cf. subviscida]